MGKRTRRSLMIGAATLAAGGFAFALALKPRHVPLAADATADRVVVRKADRGLTLFRSGQPLKTYAIALGFGEPGPKSREGDGRTPEGLYHISGRNPKSAFHLSLRISYPDEEDIAAARAQGVSPGGDIMIHGMRNGFGWLGSLARAGDWTAGCIAVTNEEIEEIWRAVPDGTPIEILP